MMVGRAASISDILMDPNVDPVSRMMAILEAGVISDQMYVEFLQGEIGKKRLQRVFQGSAGST